MFIHNIDPAILHLGPLEIRYYGLIYIIGFTLAYFIMQKTSKIKGFDKDAILDYLFYIAVGAIIGARLFYVIIYNPMYFIPRIWESLFIWQGGLSFHGGLIGALISGVIFAKKRKIDLLKLMDITVIPLALGLMLGRIGNFINGELVGRVTDVSWCFRFPNHDGCRHPFQLYESVKNLVIFFILWHLNTKNLKKGTLFGVFLVMYSTLRFFIEFVREPDVQIGYLYGLTMGQILNIIMFIAGIIWLYFVNKRSSV